MRDFVLGPIILALTAYGLLHPWLGVLGWTWVSIMNPHTLSWNLSQLPVAAAVAPAAPAAPAATTSAWATNLL